MMMMIMMVIMKGIMMMMSHGQGQHHGIRQQTVFIGITLLFSFSYSNLFCIIQTNIIQSHCLLLPFIVGVLHQFVLSG